MTQSSKLFELGQLAEASYANFIPGTDQQIALLTDASPEKGVLFTEAQAAEFSLHWKYVAHQPDTASGFSATLFERIDTDPVSGFQAGQYVYAIRGTMGVFTDLFATDGGDIVLDGLAIDQIVDLYNDWQRIQAGAGQTYQAAKLDTLMAETLVRISLNITARQAFDNQMAAKGYIIDAPTGQVRQIVKQSSDLVFAAGDARIKGVGIASLNSSLTDVTGHSLGGHLADAFTRLFGGQTPLAEALTVNGAGFATGYLPGVGLNAAGNIANVFQALGGAGQFNPLAINNLYADSNPEFITMDSALGLEQPGHTDAVFTEQGTPWTQTFGHGSGQMTDSLAVYDLLIRLDPGLKVASPGPVLAKLKSLFEAAGNQAINSLEKLVNALADLFGTGIQVAPEETYQNAVLQRDALYLAINSIKHSTTYQAAIDLTTVALLNDKTASTLSGKAQQADAEGLAYRYALKQLNPFALIGVDYSQQNSNGALDLYDPVTGQGQISDKWLADRAAMLSWKLKYNNAEYIPDGALASQGDKSYDDTLYTNSALGNWDYTDYSQQTNGAPLKLAIDGVGLSLYDHQIIFGGDEAELLNGSGDSDHLYGGAGNDTLTGGKGSDYLEGGLGLDTYTYNQKDGLDTLFDSDGLGKIIWDGLQIKGADGSTPDKWKKLASNSWEDQHNHIGYNLKSESDGSQTLYISQNGDKLKIIGWQAGQLGIKLSDGSGQTSGVNIYNGDQRAPLDPISNTYKWGTVTWAADGTLTNGVAEADFNDVITGSAQADQMNGLGGNDALDGGAGDDEIDGGVGDDLLAGGSGSDTIHGGAGSDEILSATGLTVSRPSGPDDTWNVPNGEIVWTQGSTWGIAGKVNGDANGYTIYGGGSMSLDSTADVVYGDAGNDRITGGKGDDFLDGGGDNDWLTGQAGNDTQYGGAGDDWLQGDGIIINGSYWTTPPTTHGNDFLDGGDGLDTLIGGGRDDVLLGGSGDDIIYGDDLCESVLPGYYHGKDYMDGGDGNDSLDGGGQDDVFYGGNGNDTLRGDAHPNDLAASYHGNDFLDGGAGDDIILGDGGDDYLLGGLGIDGMDGGIGNDFLDGGGDGDVLQGDVGDDTLVGGDGNDTLRGGSDADSLSGDAGDDSLDGGEGNDNLDGGGDNDQLYGFGGEDTLLGGDGNDSLSGGAGNDVLDGGQGIDVLAGGAGDDSYLNIHACDDTIQDTEGHNRFFLATAESVAADGVQRYLDPLTGQVGQMTSQVGSSQATGPALLNSTVSTLASSVAPQTGGLALTFDTGETLKLSNAFFGTQATLIFADGHQLDLETLVGTELKTPLLLFQDDNGGLLYGGAGNDTLTGGSGNDQIHSALGNDYLYGADGNDGLSGGDGADTLYGGLGEDTQEGGTGADRLYGEDGADQLLGGADNDYLYGGSGNDLLDGGAGSDYLNGGRGSDTYLYNLGYGRDKIDEVADSLNIIRLGAGIAPENIVLRRPTETESSNPDGFVLDMGNGSDTLLVYQWESSGAATPAENYLIQRIEFSNGTVWSVDDIKTKLLITTSGNDTVTGFRYGDETIRGLAGDDNINGRGGNDIIFGDQGNDIIFGDQGNDSISGGIYVKKGDQLHLDGGLGDDTLSAGLGAVVFAGGKGNDQILGGNNNTVYFERGDGKDSVTFYRSTLMLGPGIGPNGLTLSLSYGWLVIDMGGGDRIGINGYAADNKQISQILFADGTVWTSLDINKRITIASTTGNDYAYGTVGNDTVNTGEGNDKLYGLAGNDTLNGGAGSDYIEGGDGNDVIDGGTGNDESRGGAGSDVYLFGRGYGQDLVYDARYGSIVNTGDVDTIRLNLLPQEILLTRGGYQNASLMLNVVGSTDSLEIYAWFDQDNISGTLQLQFSDSGIWNAAAIEAHSGMQTATVAVDYLYGGPNGDYLNGLGGSDRLYGNSGNDTLDGGGAGGYQDELYGGSGADTYVFSYGYGSVMVLDHAQNNAQSDNDTIQFSLGVRPQDVTMVQYGSDLRFTLAGSTADMLTVSGQFSNLSNRIERALFSGGVVWDLTKSTSGGTVTGTANPDNLNGTVYDDTLSGLDGDDTLVGADGSDTLNGGNGNDSLNGGDGDDLLIGSAGNEYLFGGYTGQDTLDGGTGNDTLAGNGGDTYIFGHGYGNDVVSAYNKNGIVRFNADVAQAQLKLSMLPVDTDNWSTLRIGFIDSQDTLDIRSFNPLWGQSGNILFQFADGAAWNLDRIVLAINPKAGNGNDMIYGTAIGDILAGLAGADQVYGLDGNDQLNAGLGADFVDGGAGDDTLDGGADGDTSVNTYGGGIGDILVGGVGNDTFLFGLGYGTDRVRSGNAGGAAADHVNDGDDTVLMAAGIGPADVVVSSGPNQYDLQILNIKTGDKLVLDNWLVPDINHVNRIVFADGTVWDRAQLSNRYWAQAAQGGDIQGTAGHDVIPGFSGDDNIQGFEGNDNLSGGAGNDVLSGGAGNDTLDGGAGNDTLNGGLGNDTYVFGRGYGNDLIVDFDKISGGHDQVNFAPGVAPGDITVTHDDANILLSINGTQDQLKIRWLPQPEYKIESFNFSNGVIWDAKIVEQKAGLNLNYAPVRSVTLADQIASTAENYTLVLPDLFIDPDPGDMLTYFATLADGSPLPGWLAFDPVSKTFSGLPPDSDLGQFAIQINVSDSRGNTNSESFNLSVIQNVGFRVYGSTGNDKVIGSSGGDELDGCLGVDTLIGGLGDDTYLVDLITTVNGSTTVAAFEDTVIETGGTAGGNDTLQLRGGSTNIVATMLTLAADLENLDASATGTSLLNLAGNASANILTGNAAANSLNGGAGVDTLVGGLGNDTYTVDNIGDVVTENFNEGTDLVNSSVTYNLSANVENLTLTGTAAINATGNALANVLSGNSAANILTGGDGNDTYVVDLITTGTGSAAVAQLHDIVVETSGAVGGIDTLQLSGSSTNTVATTLALAADLENLNAQYTGTSLLNLTGNASANILTGNAAANVLTGGDGNDTYVVDLVTTGSGSTAVAQLHDTVIETGGMAGGIDTLQLSGSSTNTVATTLVLDANLENLNAGNTGASLLNLTGNALANTLTGNSAVNILTGGDGNDTYVVDLVTVGNGGSAIAALHDSVIENGGTGGGIDTLQLSGSSTNTIATTLVLAADLENLNAGNTGTSQLNLTGNAANNTLTGNSAANTLIGGDGNDSLYGGAGADILLGGLGNDTYTVDNSGDVVTENLNEGTDLVISSVTYTLSANVENLTLTGTAAIDGTGNEYSNNLIGNSAANTLSGGLGNDYYVVDLITVGTGDAAVAALHDSIVETGGTVGGTDTLQLSGSSTNTIATTLILNANLENLNVQYTGNSLLNLTGNASTNTLSGNVAANILTGGDGNDTYVVDLVTIGSGASAVAVLHDTVIETGGTAGGIDTLQLSGTTTNTVATTLYLDTNLENLNAGNTGSSLLNLTGNAANNTLSGNAAANVLNGGDGNDTYVVDLVTIGNAAVLHDTVIETGGTLGGIDTLQLSGSSTNTVVTTLTLAANLENLNAGNTGTSLLNLTGNAAANVLSGNAADNTLAGGVGNDSLSGGSGNDKLYGYDVLDGSGTTLVNQLVITAKADLLADAVAAKMDVYIDGILKTSFNVANTSAYQTYTVDPALLGIGVHRIQVAFSNDVYLPGPPVQDRNLRVSGISVNGVFTAATAGGVYLDTGTGAAALDGVGLAAGTNIVSNNGALSFSLDGNDSLDGGLGTDTLSGGLGDDVYVIDTLSDVVQENFNAGIDTIKSSFTYNLNSIANIENITLTGTAAINATGDAGVNLLNGNAADNILDGGNGIDSLVGGAGNDTYIVDLVTNGNVAALQDSIYESSTTTNGIDTLQLRGSSTNIVATTLGLATHLENLDAGNTGNSQLNLTGNASDNRLTGNAANNILNGGAGNDSLIGGAGNDTLIGGTGNDTYQFGLGSGAEVIQENDATIGNNDIVAVIGGIDINQLWFRQLGNDLEMSVIGTGDKTTFSNWYSGSAYHVEQISDGGKTLADTKIDALVQAMAAFAPPAAGQTTLPANYQTTLVPVIATSWQ